VKTHRDCNPCWIKIDIFCFGGESSHDGENKSHGPVYFSSNVLLQMCAFLPTASAISVAAGPCG